MVGALDAFDFDQADVAFNKMITELKNRERPSFNLSL